MDLNFWTPLLQQAAEFSIAADFRVRPEQRQSGYG
jgi:hypothetical protein